MLKMSIIVPVYNVEDYLNECIQSVLNQTYKEFEIILVNDGSTDGSGILCDHFARENPNCVSVIHSSNQGPLSARMLGIKEARGDILLFLDSDDSFREDALEKLAACFLRHKCDLVLFDTGDSLSYPSISLMHALTEDVVYQAETKKYIYSKLMTYQIPNGVCLKAIKKDCVIFDDALAQFSNLKHGEDLLMSAYFVTHCDSIVYLKEGLYHYRARTGSTVHSFDVRRKESIKTVHTELEKCIDLWGMPELKPLHNARKVRGWIDTLIILLKNRDRLDGKTFQEQLRRMAEDPYFTTANTNMDASQLSGRYRMLAFCLLKKQYLLLYILAIALKVKKN